MDPALLTGADGSEWRRHGHWLDDQPGIWFGNNEEGRKNARDCNEYGAKLAQDYPGRFGMWGAIPLPDTDGSLREIEYIYDKLKLDGIGLLTSYDDGKMLGHPNFAPVLEELNRRKAVIFVHPTVSCCAIPVAHVNRVAIDFPTDTTRTITDLIYSGSLMRLPNIRWIFSHGGGTVLMLAARLAGAGLTPEEKAATIPNGFEHELQKLVLRRRQRRAQPRRHGGGVQRDSQGSSFVWIGYPVFYD